MANNCYNYITITGSKEHLNALKTLLESNQNENGTLNFDKILDREFKDMYDEIGTRWMYADIETYFEDEEPYMNISGDSAWSPALPFFNLLSLKFDSLKIEYDYEESGCDFGGWANIEKGLIQDNCFKYWEYKFKRDLSYALEIAHEEAESILQEEGEAELLEHDIFKYMPEEEKAAFLEQVKASNKTTIEQ